MSAILFSSSTDTPPVPPVTAPLSVDRTIFRVHGQPWRWQYLSMFTALRRWCAGEDLSPLIAQTHALGYTGWRVFCQHYYMDWPAIRPFVAPISQIRPFVDTLAAHGLRVELTVLCDCQPEALHQSVDEQASRLSAMAEAVSGAPSVSLEWANEPGDNGVDLGALLRAVAPTIRRACLQGSGWYPVTGSEPTDLVLDITTDHPPRKDTSETEAAKIGEYVYRQTGKPWIGDEWLKFGTADSDGPAVSDPQRAAELFAGMALGGAGGTFHAISGIHSEPFNATEIACARAAADAFAAFPAEAPLGTYWHDGIPGPLVAVNDPTVVGEVAGRLCGDTAYAVAARASAQYRPQPAPGWRLVARSGAKGERLVLERG